MDDQDRRLKPKPFVWIALIVAAVAAAAAIAAGIWYRLQEKRRLAARRPAPTPPVIPVEGLTEAEAEARQVEGQDNVIQLKPPRTKQEIWHENVYNLFNLSLVGLAASQLLLGIPLDALLSLGTIAFNVGINIFQEMFARRRVQDIQQATRPQVTVVRDEKVRSVDPAEIVVGDAIVLGPGDQILVDGELIGEGQIVVDESVLTGYSTRQIRRPGDRVYAGSFCLSGRAACLVEKTGSDRLITSRLAETPEAKEQLTAIERVIEHVLKVLLGVVALMTIFLLFRYFNWDMGPVPVDAFGEVISLVFSIAPVTLFFMIVVTYASGTADLGRLGALVNRARSVESLAQATVICFAQEGILTGTHVDLELEEPREDQEQLSESRLRQILGDFARTSSVDNLPVRAIRDTFEGSQRVPLEEAPFMSVYGWSALAFDDDDLRGVYVLAEPEILAARLPAEDEEPEEIESGEEGSPIKAVRRAFAPVGRLFRRGKDEPQDDESPQAEQEASTTGASPADATTPASQSAPLLRDEAHPEGAGPVDGSTAGKDGTPSTETSAIQEATPAGEEEEDKDSRVRGFFRGLGKRLKTTLRRGEGEEKAEESPQHDQVEEDQLSFAYVPDLTAIHDADGQPHLPDGLIRLCTLHYSERVRPESVETIKTFTETGLDIKVFASGEPEHTARMLRQAGLTADEGYALETTSGPDLAGLSADEFVQAADEKAIFGLLTPEQAGQVVAALRRAGEAVAVVGDGVGDLSSMRQANLAISRQSSTQAALSMADIILMEDSPTVLGVVLKKGQRIVNGLMDILKLNLTQVSYLAILLVAVPLFSRGYPYRSGQGTAITVLTVAIPSLGLTLGAASGVQRSVRLGRLLARFVVPAALAISAAAFLVYLLFLDRGGGIRYAQLGVTYTLVACGLWLVVLIKPPRRPSWSSSTQGGAWWPVIMAVVLMALFVGVSAIPLAQDLLHLGLLKEPTDYLIVALAVLAWAITLRLVLFIIPVDPDQGRPAKSR